ncbi:MAG: hypothetical protein KatS3mg068_1645 [Candidatus Sericytochromatia bacterium]|nr:MAG: hypothetical protein KatS3mg068_1645 [Candidatus Sericytochromatia bacterium]
MISLNFANFDDKKLNKTQRKLFSIINYKLRIHNEKLLKVFLFNFDIEAKFTINQKNYIESFNYCTIYS